jgi:cytochrome c oxidase subunit 2
LIGIVALAVLVIIAPWPGANAAPVRREIHVNARMFAFEPARLRVNRGDQVTLILHSDDVVHGLYLDGYDVNVQAAPGRSIRATFVADRAGKFRYRCAVSCGSLHPFMIGELIVGPNVLFWRAILLTIIAAAGAVAFFYVRSLEAAG